MRTRKRSVRATATEYLYLGCFSFDEPGEEDYQGTFQIVVEAADPGQALDRMRARLRRLRTTTSLFDKPSTIYVDTVIKLKGSFKEALLVNWVSGPEQSPSWKIGCAIPEQDHEAEAYDAVKGKKKETVEPFLDFGGQAFRKAVHAKTKTDASAPSHSAGLTTSTRSLKPRLTPEETAAKRREAEQQKELRRAERAAAQRKREAALEAKKARQRSITETLAELRGD
jgi:hypothetical protein